MTDSTFSRSSSPEIPPEVRTDLQTLGITVAEEALQQMACYLDLLLEANQRMNLTAIRDPAQAWHRLIVDSLTILPGLAELPAGARVIDIGTGGGLPGMPIAIARPDLQVWLLDGTGKKVRFLEETIRTLGLTHVQAVQARAEDLGHDPQHREQYDAVTNRAMGAMSIVLEYGLPLLKVDGFMLAMKGPKAEQELRDAGDALEKLGAGPIEVFDAYPPSFENDLVVVVVPKDRRTPRLYPRLAGLPKRSPL